MKITKLLSVLILLSILMAPALSTNIAKSCTCASEICNGPCKMACCHKCPNDLIYAGTGTCDCRISSLSGTEVYDPYLACIGRGSSRPNTRDGHSVSSTDPDNGGIYPISSRADFDGIGPPDLDVIEYLPPSARQVFNTLASYGPLTQKDIISKTELPRRTVRYALSRLKEEGIIRECFYFPDARQSLYSLHELNSTGA